MVSVVRAPALGIQHGSAMVDPINIARNAIAQPRLRPVPHTDHVTASARSVLSAPNPPEAEP